MSIKYYKLQGGTHIVVAQAYNASVTRGNSSTYGYGYNGAEQSMLTRFGTVFSDFLLSSASVGDKVYLENGNYFECVVGLIPNAGYTAWKPCWADGTSAGGQFEIYYDAHRIYSDMEYMYLTEFQAVDGFGSVVIGISAPNHTPLTLNTQYGFYPRFGSLVSSYSPFAYTVAAKYPVSETWVADVFFGTPYEQETFPGNPSGTGGGTGSFDATSDDITIPGLPTLSAVTAGFITLFAPSISQLNSLASYMWSSAFDLDTFKKLFADPMDAIIGLSIVPVAVPVSGLASVKIGFTDSGVLMNLASSQYVTVNCGTLTPAEYWGSALDYSPYTKFSIHLPYIGTRELNTDDIMGKTLQVVYNIDILSGACTAMIKCGGSVLYEFSGACATSIPVTGQNWTQLITSCIQLAGAGIAVAASGGSAAGLLPSTANAVMAMKPNIQRTGAVSGSAGMLGVQQPYLIWELPRQSIAEDYNKFVGYPSNITALLSTLTGYTQIESVHLENIPATQSELAEIETLLKEGVII